MGSIASRRPAPLTLCFAGLLLGQFIAVLDVQIITASLVTIQAGISAAPDEMSWVQTTYLIAETVGIPIGAFCVKRFGFRASFAASCGLFIFASLAVGFTTSLEGMIAARSVQGFLGGMLLPLAFIFGFSMFPPERIGAISLTLAIVAVLAPTAGPVVGGYISEYFGWRWIFFINVPLGLLALSLVSSTADRAWGVVGDDPQFDWLGAGLLSLGLASTLFVLEEGQREGWLDSDMIVLALTVSALSWTGFFWQSAGNPASILELKIFRNADFSTGWTLVSVGGVSLFGGSFLLPLFLGEIRNYSPQQIGDTLVVSGAMMVVSGLLIMPRLNGINLKLPIAIGFGFTGYGFLLGAYATDQWGFWEMAALQTWRGIGIIVAITATQTLTMQSIAPTLTGSATTALYLARNLGGALGVSVISSMLAQQTRQAYLDIVSSPEMRRAAGYSDEPTASNVAAAMRSARLIAYNNAFEIVALLCFCAVALSLTLRSGSTRPVEANS